MAYKAIVIPVMIASPGDVIEERDIIRKVIYDWNDMHSEKEGVILYPKGWDTHSSPELTQGKRAQDLINLRVLRNCDILIGVFWTRIGTPTGKAKSGTVEEIEEHVNKGKPAMVYFSNKPIPPDKVDRQQYQEVLAFKDKCKILGMSEPFKSTEELKDKLTKQLVFCLNHNEYINSIIKAEKLSASITDKPEIEQQKEELQLSDEAKTLLKDAADSGHGVIFFSSVAGGGKFIQAGNEMYGLFNSKEFAEWRCFLDELRAQRLVKQTDQKGEAFELTHQGWQLADSLKSEK